MNKRLLALTISSALLMNSVAFAGSSTPIRPLSDAELLTDVTAGRDQTVKELETALDQVSSLIITLKKSGQDNETDPILRYGNKVEIVLAAVSAYSMHVHLANADKTNLKLGASVGALLVHKVLAIYKERGRLDASTVANQVGATADELNAMGALPSEIAEARKALNTLSDSLLANQSELQNAVSNLGGTEDMALILNIGYFALHLAYPKIAKEADGFLKNILPKVQQLVQKGAELGKTRTAVYGTGAAVGLPDVLSLTLGVSSKQAQDIVTRTVRNLDSVSIDLKTQIEARKAK